MQLAMMVARIIYSKGVEEVKEKRSGMEPPAPPSFPIATPFSPVALLG